MKKEPFQAPIGSISICSTFRNRPAGAVAQTGRKDFRINIRIAGRDVTALKTRALEEGIPYQTLAAMILRDRPDDRKNKPVIPKAHRSGSKSPSSPFLRISSIKAIRRPRSPAGHPFCSNQRR